MAKAKPVDLFDLADQEESSECLHLHMCPTLTQWPNTKPGDVRMTMTCVDCGFVRGRWPREGMDRS